MIELLSVKERSAALTTSSCIRGVCDRTLSRNRLQHGKRTECVSWGDPTRRGTVEFIQAQGLLHLRPADLQPYRTCKEESWKTDIAWERKNAVIVGYVNNCDWNSWEITRLGREFIHTVHARCRESKVLVSQNPLWSVRFKRLLHTGFEPSNTDRQPPPKSGRAEPSLRVYQRTINEILRSRSIEELARSLGEKLGVAVPATKPSVAFAYKTYIDGLL